jgi:hypothetical protein
MPKFTDEYFVEQQEQIARDRADPETRERMVIQLLLAHAAEGNHEPLARYIEDGGVVTAEIRVALVNLLRAGKVNPRGRGRPGRTLEQVEWELKVVSRVAELEASGEQRSRAVSLVAEEFKETGRTVYKAMASQKEAFEYFRSGTEDN